MLAVAPTLTDTPGVAGLPSDLAGRGMEEVARSRAAAIPLGRIGVAYEVARAVLFCASDVAALMTGAVLKIDGGLLAS